MRKSIWLIALIVTMTSLACQTSKQQNSTSIQPNAKQHITIDTLVNLPPDFKPAYTIAEVRDVSFAATTRHVVSIKLPSNLQKEVLEQNFKHAIKDTYLKKKSNAISIWGYRNSDSVDATFTVGEAVFAPNGSWEDAMNYSSADLDHYEILVKIKDQYLNPIQLLSIGTNVFLESKTFEYVFVSDSASAWHDENRVAKLTNGTSAKILEAKEFPMAGDFSTTVRYRIKAGKVEGWVFGSDVELKK